MNSKIGMTCYIIVIKAQTHTSLPMQVQRSKLIFTWYAICRQTHKKWQNKQKSTS